MTLRATWILVGLFIFRLPIASAADYDSLRADAEKLYAEGSYSRAKEVYQQITLTNLPSVDQRWVRFRLADTQWRSAAATQTADTTRLDEARRRLEVLVRDVTRDEERDLVWAEVQESLGDFWWTRRNNNNWGEAWPHYQQALDWWAGARDVNQARQRYLAVVWRLARPPQVEPYYYYGYWGNYVPLDVLENALKIASTDNDRAHAHFLIAMTLRSQAGSEQQRARVPEEFEQAIQTGKTSDWYDDALYNYAEWMAGQGRMVPLENGGWRAEPDYVRALELFRRLVSEFSKGETRFWEQAQGQIRNITEPQLSVSVPNIFLPDSEIQYFLNWRNVKQIELALYPVELNRDVKFPNDDGNAHDWLSSIDLTGRKKIRSWSYDPRVRSSGFSRSVPPKGGTPNDDYKPGNDALRLDGKLKPGAYLLTATGAGKSARELVLVTDVAMVLKTSGKQALIYVCNALDGSPVANAGVKIWESWWDDNHWHSREHTGNANQDGLVVFALETRRPRDNIQIFASAIHADRQAFTAGNSYWNNRDEFMDPTTGLPLAGRPFDWHIYAFTDRPAYRPKETVNWKFIARDYDGSVYSTPSGRTIEFEITDPRDAKVKSDKAKLNAFGSAWGALELTESMPLGEYRVTFWDEGRHHQIGAATLFRLEEYKLPEFKVTVQMPEEDGRKKTFRLGEKVEATIQADYYFGGPVASASVEVLVHQSPYWHGWHEPRSYTWYYEDMEGGGSPYGGRGRWYGGDQIIKRETVKTDATGRATITFDAPENGNQDFEYRIEARVTDASRREIAGSGTVRVTRQRYYVYPAPAHNLYGPQDKVTVNFKALDANEQPVSTEGTVKVTRDYWFEIWLAPDGHEVKGEELKRIQSQNRIWPPRPARPDQKEWRLKFQGYEHDDILTQTLKTDTNGQAELTFAPGREGYYRVAWSSEDLISNLKSQISNPIKAETAVWIGTGKTVELGYRSNGLEIIADKDTFRVGQKAPVMIVAPTSGRYVLFSVEGEDLYSYQLVHLDGTVKLIELPVEEKYVPNMFLSAALVSDRQIFLDSKQIIVPPTKNFLTVDLKPDRAQYQPREDGTLTITTKNDEGKPVSAEVSLGLVDESVFYIQSDYAGDPREFFFGTKRAQQIQTQATMNQKNYAKLVEWDDEQLVDERVREQLVRNKESLGELGLDRDYKGFGGGGGGGSRIDELSSGEVRHKAGGLVMNDVATAGVSGATAEAPPMTTNEPKLAEAATGLAAGKSAMRHGEELEPAVVVRSDFRSTVFWQPDVVTDKNGQAVVKVKYPDSLTGWKATARAVTAGNQFGIADTTTQTKQPLMVRLEAPRFFVVGDTVTISAVVNNNFSRVIAVRTVLEANGIDVFPLNAPNQNLLSSYIPTPEVQPGGEVRVDWRVKITRPGVIKFKLTGTAGDLADAMEKTYIAYEHGIEKFISKSGKARGGDVTVKLDLPSERKPGSTSLTVQIAPSIAVTMLDALPYLIDYPYGCTEQTMSRFLPAAITAKTLRDLGLQPEEVMGRVFGGIETNTAAATHPHGARNLAELEKIETASLDRLYNFQHADGGWGWWKEGESDHWMTAYVVWGLSLARDAGIEVKTRELHRAVNYLDKTLIEEEENPDEQAFMLHALAAYTVSQKQTKPTRFQQKAFYNLWTKRDQLNAYTRALLALSAHYFGFGDEARILIANLENGVKRDDRPDASVLLTPDTSHLAPDPSLQGTAHWGEDGIYWRWSEGGVEATAFALRALLAIDPTNRLVEPVSNWLIKNRRGAQWNSTRDTAIVVLALNDYLRRSGEAKANVEYELIVNGTSIAKKKISGAEVFNAPSRFVIDASLIRDHNDVQIKTKPGATALYFAVEGKFFSTEEPITPAGNEIFVKRGYYKLAGRPTLLKGYVYDKVPLADGDSVKSGERVETVLTIEAKNNYEYLMFEDLKPAGFEAAEIRSGETVYARELKSGAVKQQADQPRAHEIQSGDTLSKLAGIYGVQVREIENANPGLDARRLRIGAKIIIPPGGRAEDESDYTGRQRWVYQELRDRKVALFIDRLPQGIWEIRYDERAEVPGRFHALPALGQAMYVPEIRCNSAEIRVNVEDTK